MWLCLNDCFLSIVSKDCARDELLVRARRKGDIETIFPGARVQRSAHTDYLFRAVVKRAEVEAAVVGELRRITYGNFKDSVKDNPLHDAYMRVWTEMALLQPTHPYTGRARTLSDPPPSDFKLHIGGQRGFGTKIISAQAVADSYHHPDIDSPYLFKNDTVDRETLKAVTKGKRKRRKAKKLRKGQ